MSADFELRPQQEDPENFARQKEFLEFDEFLDSKNTSDIAEISDQQLAEMSDQQVVATLEEGQNQLSRLEKKKGEVRNQAQNTDTEIENIALRTQEFSNQNPRYALSFPDSNFPKGKDFEEKGNKVGIAENIQTIKTGVEKKEIPINEYGGEVGNPFIVAQKPDFHGKEVEVKDIAQVDSALSKKGNLDVEQKSPSEIVNENVA